MDGMPGLGSARVPDDYRVGGIAVGIDRRDARQLCADGGQSAVVYVDRRGVPEMLLPIDVDAPRGREGLLHVEGISRLADERLVVDVYLSGSMEVAPAVDLDGALTRLCLWPNVPGEDRLRTVVADVLMTRWASQNDPSTSAGVPFNVAQALPLEQQSGAMSATRSQQLFGVNWADSRPGVSWKEVYDAHYVSHRDRYIVTATQESSDAYGSTDQAIGHFPGSVPVREGIRAVIIAYWREYYAWSECGWEALEGEGCVGATTVEAMRDEVWPARSDDHETDVE